MQLFTYFNLNKFVINSPQAVKCLFGNLKLLFFQGSSFVGPITT